MTRIFRLALVCALLAAALAGTAYAATRRVPPNDPALLIQNTSTPLPGNTKALDSVLTASSTVKYKLLVIEETGGEDMTAYLDRVAADWQMPGHDQLLLVVFTKASYDIRFFMGADFRSKGLDVQEMLGYVRTFYFSKVRAGDPAGGLADYISVVNARMTRTSAEGFDARAALPQASPAKN